MSDHAFDEHWALSVAVGVANQSPCRKSQRGVVIWAPTGLVATGYNHLPAGMICDGSATCREHCGKRCIHAEAHALLCALRGAALVSDMLHVKVVAREPVPSGGPSCWQCSRHILDRGIRRMWLLHEDGLRAYTAEEFHRLTLEACGMAP